MMEILRSGYLGPFHHLPPVSQEPVEFPSYSSGSAKAQALQAEVDKMLEKGDLGVVDCSDRILTFGIRSICSPAKVGIGYYKAVNYQPGS